MKLHWTALNLNDITQTNAPSLEVVNNCIDLLEKHLEILNEQKTVTSDAIDKTMIEGDSLLDYLKEIGSKNDQNNDNPSGASNSYKQHSNSYVHLEGKLVYLNFSFDYSFNKR